VRENVQYISHGVQSSVAAAALACSITAGACCVGMRTSVCGNGGASSAFFSASASSFGLGSFAITCEKLEFGVSDGETYWTPC
jgi:hypothetical protein